MGDFDLVRVSEILHIYDDALPWFFPLLMVVLGGVFGSFITCAVYRVPRQLSLRNPPSACPKCKSKLAVIDLIPIFSYLLFKGRCRQCQHPIPQQYFLVELVSVLLLLMCYWSVGAQVALLVLIPCVLSAWFYAAAWYWEGYRSTKVLLFSFILFVVFINLQL